MIGVTAYDFADAVGRNLNLRLSADDRAEVARLFMVAMCEAKNSALQSERRQGALREMEEIREDLEGVSEVVEGKTR